MRTLRNIFAIIALLSASSCAVDNVDTPSYGVNNSDVVTVLGRMTRFDDKDVTTRGVKDENEARLTSMAVAIFPVNADGTALSGPCAHWQYTDNQAELLFEINRSVIGFKRNARYAMYVFCNMPELEGFGIGSSLDAMLTTAQNVSGINIPENGFPMMGSLGDTFSTAFDKDNQILILSPTKNNLDDGELVAPTVAKPKADGSGWGDPQTQTLLTIPMKAMFAKVNFSIEVRPDQTIEGHYSPQFELTGYTVKNVPSEVDFSYNTNSDSEVSSDKYTLGVSGSAVASGANKINFTFYLPERLLTADKSLDSVLPANLRNKGAGFYDISVDADQNGYRDEDEVYHQRFKSKLVDDSKKATNIVLSGQFRDHQNHYWDVEYTIFLGENNSTDFNIKRNSEYNNFVTIRGIQSSDDMSSDKDNAISIDHRVNVERTQPAIISLRREVLLDSHFEVRPLRIRKSNVTNSNINAVKVEVVNAGSANDKSGTWWMRLERSFGEGGDGKGKEIYITDGVSAGKRKYFTFDLITGNGTATLGDLAPLTKSTSVIVPLNEGEQCVWIYVDECTEVGDEVRAGIVKVSYGNYNGTDFTPTTDAAYPAVSYVINQRKLFEVKYDNPSTTTDENRKYHIEFEEEYLHNFDADDNYGQTDYEGMQWGLPGIQLSYDKEAVMLNSSEDSFADVKNDVILPYSPYYDFYVTKYDSGKMPDAAKRRDYSGYLFCTEIIQTINGGQKDSNGNAYDADLDNNIDVLQLDEKPNSAIEYCYNKNKRNRNGQVAWTGNSDNLNWYLPAIDEMEDIVMSKYGGGLYTYARFIDFQGKNYWSSQPSYYQSYVHYSIGSLAILWWINSDDFGTFAIDDVNRARSTKVEYNNGQYSPKPSGTDGYYSALVIDGRWLLTQYRYINHYILADELANSDSFTYEYNNHSFDDDYYGTKTFTRDDLPKYESGNLSRTSYARVRCVRKSQYTNTSAN